MMPGAEQAGKMNIDEMQETGMNILSMVASIITLPVEIFLRPQFGTRYFAAPIFFLSSILLMLLSAFSGVAAGIGQMLPGQGKDPVGVYGIGSFTTLFFMASLVHGFRTFRRMTHPELELISTFEGPPLPIFALLPYGHSFWVVRIFWEGLFVIAVAILLSNFLIIQTALKLYLEIVGCALAMKNYIQWFRSWTYIRTLMDMTNIGPVLANIVSGAATDEELERVHLASLPRNLPDDMRRATVEYMARAFHAPEPRPPQPPNPEAGSSGLIFILRALIVSALICFGMSWLTGYRQHIRMATQHLTVKRSPFDGKADTSSPQVPAVNTAPDPVPPPPALTKMTGYWLGRGYLSRRGMCTIHLEIRRAPDNHFAAYSTLVCIPMGRIIYSGMRPIVPTPTSAILSGTIADGSIRFRSEKNIDGAGTGCVMKMLNATPFGARQITAEWKDDPCHGGQMILARVQQ
jgi:hypothetical protein